MNPCWESHLAYFLKKTFSRNVHPLDHRVFFFSVFCIFTSFTNFLSKGEKRWSSLVFKPNENEICLVKSSTKPLSLTSGKSSPRRAVNWRCETKAGGKRKKKMCCVCYLTSLMNTVTRLHSSPPIKRCYKYKQPSHFQSEWAPSSPWVFWCPWRFLTSANCCCALIRSSTRPSWQHVWI